MSMTRSEHLQWCKDRAIAYVNAGDHTQATASMLSDLRKHPETEGSAQLGGMLMMSVNDEASARKFILGFN